jgi:hypothetical protein
MPHTARLEPRIPCSLDADGNQVTDLEGRW